jgi:hypothetical protein
LFSYWLPALGGRCDRNTLAYECNGCK